MDIIYFAGSAVARIVGYAIWRAVAQRRPFLCPECGAAVPAG